ncbi:Hypothetical predicted protein [Octopus vulgaris]|uniref:Uncharacterized protein n=1 Tax=Octopus vulgaris TaxID=6645 RepID=A0AA36F4U3_OCTVU|nr:Hypothetical predicted protein [Octopus vulgaris]
MKSKHKRDKMRAKRTGSGIKGKHESGMITAKHQDNVTIFTDKQYLLIRCWFLFDLWHAIPMEIKKRRYESADIIIFP